MILSVGGGNKWEYTSVLQLESHTELEMVHLENRGTCQYGNEVGGAGRCACMDGAGGVVVYLALFSVGIQGWEWWWAENVLSVDRPKSPHVRRANG